MSSGDCLSAASLRSLKRKDLQAIAKSRGVKANLPTHEIIRLILRDGSEAAAPSSPPSALDQDSLSSLSRAQLQALAKQAGIKANHKTADLIQLLASSSEAKACDSPKVIQRELDPQDASEPVLAEVLTGGSCAEADSLQEQPSSTECIGIQQCGRAGDTECCSDHVEGLYEPGADCSATSSELPNNPDVSRTDSVASADEASSAATVSRPWALGLLERVGEARKALRTSIGRASLGEPATPKAQHEHAKPRPPCILVDSPMLSGRAAPDGEAARGDSSSSHAISTASGGSGGAEDDGDEVASLPKRRREGEGGVPITSTPSYRSFRAARKRRRVHEGEATAAFVARIAGMCESIKLMAATPTNTPARGLPARAPLQPLDPAAFNLNAGLSGQRTVQPGLKPDAERERPRLASSPAQADASFSSPQGRLSDAAPPPRKSGCRGSFGIKGPAQRVLTPHRSQPAPKTPLARVSIGAVATPRRSIGECTTPRSAHKAPWRI